MSSFYPVNDAEFSVWLGNFIAVATTNRVVLGLGDADLAALTAAKTALDAKITASQSANDAAKSATTAKKTTRKSTNALIGYRAKVINANAAIPADIKRQLGLTVRDSKPTSTPPNAPVNLMADGFSTGVNQLDWDTNGNLRGTQYLIEAAVGSATAFKFVGTTTKSRFEHKGQTPGVQVIYRVKAQRADKDSEYSNDALVYRLALAA